MYQGHHDGTLPPNDLNHWPSQDTHGRSTHLMGVQTSAYLSETEVGVARIHPIDISCDWRTADEQTSVTHPSRMVRAVCGVKRTQRP